MRIRADVDAERLVAKLASDLAGDPLPPFSTETIVVPSHGVRRYLTLRLADHLGIAASLTMLLPRTFVAGLTRTVFGAPGRVDDLAEPDVFLWRIHRLLGDLPDAAELAPLRGYLAGEDPGGARRLQLAQRIAERFSDYLLRRLDLLVAWESNAPHPDDERTPHAAWQRWLWRRAVAELRPRQGSLFEAPLVGAERLRALPEALRRGDFDTARLPARVHVVATATLPAAVVAVLEALEERVPVALHVVVPTLHDLRDVDIGSGNPLLARFGAAARPLFSDLARRAEEGTVTGLGEAEAPLSDRELIAGGSLLRVVQEDVRQLTDRRSGGDAAPLPWSEFADDTSLQIHDCYSPLRELECLREALLAAFDADPSLRSEDVVVLLPDVRTYAPLVQAVFGHRGDRAAASDDGDAIRLPFRIADRGAGAASRVAIAFRQLLELVGSRHTAADMLELLGQEPVAARFGITRRDLPAIRDRVERAGIRWGIDAAHRHAAFSVPAFAAGSWRLGLDRLLAGYAFGPDLDPAASDDAAPLAGTLPEPLPPVAGATGGDADLLGALCAFATAVFDTCVALEAEAPLADHARGLGQALDRLFLPVNEDDAAALTALRTTCGRLAEVASLAAVREPVPFAAVRAFLEQALGDAQGGADFMSGGITFCALRPLRTVPFRVVCIAGLNDGVFPRRDARLPFDMIAEAPRPGDVSVRRDDEYLFLEALLAARDKLILTFVGRSQKDRQPVAASACIEELLDQLDRCLVFDGAARARDVVVTRHPLHAFSPRYFAADRTRLFSFSESNLRGCLARHANVPVPRFVAALGADVPALEGRPTVALKDLVTFWKNPGKFLCRSALGLRVPRDRETLPETELFREEPLDVYRVHEALAAPGYRAAPAEVVESALKTLGILRLGTPGGAALLRLCRDLSDYLAALPNVAVHEPFVFVLEDPRFVLQGELDGLTREGRCTARPSKLKAKVRIETWIPHLVLCALHEAGELDDVPPRSRHVARDGGLRFGPVSAPRDHLALLIAGFVAGQEAALPFFEHASEPVHRGRPPREAWGFDVEDPFVALCVRGRDPLRDELEAVTHWAKAVFDPLLAAEEGT